MIDKSQIMFKIESQSGSQNVTQNKNVKSRLLNDFFACLFIFQSIGRSALQWLNGHSERPLTSGVNGDELFG